VSTAYDPTEWHDLFVAIAGASAALLGLLFVAISINIERIMENPGLPERGLETLMLLLGVLVVSIAGLLPGQSHAALGLELAAITAVLVASLTAMSPVGRPPGPRSATWMASRWALRAAGPALLGIGALAELTASAGGLYWIAAGIVFAILGAVANAWVLLVEILR
jgi:modulator of FtsH protease